MNCSGNFVNAPSVLAKIEALAHVGVCDMAGLYMKYDSIERVNNKTGWMSLFLYLAL